MVTELSVGRSCRAESGCLIAVLVLLLAAGASGQVADLKIAVAGTDPLRAENFPAK